MTGHAPESKTWTTRQLLAWTTDHFQAKGLDRPRLCAEMLLAHVLGTSRLKLYMHADRPASELERSAFRELVARAVRHEPVDYLVGQSPFYSLWFKVTPAVLVPRPSTEALVDHVLQHARRRPGFGAPLIADVGTGSGVIAVTLAKHLPGARVLASDISDSALAVARENAQRHGVADRIDFVQGDMLEPLRGKRVQYLLSNPPYISDAEWQVVPANVKNYEPTGALRGGVDGLDYLAALIAGAREHLAMPGQLVLEIAASQSESVLELTAKTPGLAHEHVLADHEALPRVLVADAV